MITFDNLSKRYGHVNAVDSLSFQVEPGHVTGFLGPNGAGKTTTLRMATGLIQADSGSVLFDGKTYKQLAKPMSKVGVALEPTTFHPGRTALDHLLMLAPCAQVDKRRCMEMLGFVGLQDVANKRVGKFSLGMRGRLNLAASMLGDPEFLLLDEPVNGLDPEGIRWIRELLQGLASQGKTVLTSSHLLSEVEQTVDEVVIIAHGKLMYQGTLEGLQQKGTPKTTVETSQVDELLTLARTKGWTVDQPEGAHSLSVAIEGPSNHEIAVAAFDARIILDQITVASSGLEDTFFALTEGEGTPR